MRASPKSGQELESALTSIPLMDPHTHLDAAHLSARGLDDILLYHMAVSDLFAAGCPNGARVPEDRTEGHARERVLEALPYLPKARNTAMAWGVRIILGDLYDWHEPVTTENWERLDAAIRERAADPVWPREILKRAGIVRTGTELWRGRDGAANDILQYSLEWAFFARTQWGQPDIPLYELERAWNATEPGVPIPVTFDRASAPPMDRTIRSVEDVDAAVAHYCDLIPYDKVMATAQHLSTDIDYAGPGAEAMKKALGNRPSAGNAERDVYASYILRRFLGELPKRGEGIVFQFSLGAEPLPYESAARLSQRTIAQLGELIANFPDVRFMCFLASRHGNQSLCTLARELPNLSLAGYWWHNFFPGAIRQVMEERLDMLPLNKQIGFFSDAYCAEWSYAKAVMVRKLLAEVMAGKVALGQYSRDDALSIAQGILHDSPCELLGMKGVRGIGGATGFQPVSFGETGCDLSGESSIGEDLTRLAGQDARLARDHGLEGHGTSNLGQDAQATSGEDDSGADGGSVVDDMDINVDYELIDVRQGAYLPHWTQEFAVYSVTFRLEDSLPREVVQAWLAERNEIVRRAQQMGRPLTLEEEKRLQYLFSEKVDRYLDAGYGACWMKDDRIAGITAGSLLHFNGERYRLVAWCVMPNHVHVVVQPLPGFELQEILHTWKSYTANQANAVLRRSGAFWQTESYDHLIRDGQDFSHSIEYVIENPSKAGLTNWKWVRRH